MHKGQNRSSHPDIHFICLTFPSIVFYGLFVAFCGFKQYMKYADICADTICNNECFLNFYCVCSFLEIKYCQQSRSCFYIESLQIPRSGETAKE